MTDCFAPAVGRRPRFAAPLATIIATATVLSGCAKAPSAAPANDVSSQAGTDPATTVTFSAAELAHGGVLWAPATFETVASTLEVPGQLVAHQDHTASIGAPAEGRVLEVHVRSGDPVRLGAALVTLQSPAAAAARADYAKATAALLAAQAQASFAERTRARAERLLQIKAVARQDVERALADDEQARATLNQAQAEVARARAALLQLGVDSTSGTMVLRAPLNGVVLSRTTAPGVVVHVGDSLVSVTDPGLLELHLSVPDRVAPMLKPGAPVRFAVPAYPADTFSASVLRVSAGLDAESRTVGVEATARNGTGRLRPGMFATVWLQSGDRRPAAVLPDSAVQQLDQVPVVFVARPDGHGGARFERRTVRVGTTTGGRTQITDGLERGDLVVTGGAFAVKSQFSRSKMPKE